MDVTTDRQQNVDAASLCAGREHELRRLRELYDQAHAGRSGRLALITGPEGIGKSRLLCEARRRFKAAGVPVLEGHCVGGGAYEPFVDVARAALAHLAEAGAGGAELERAAGVVEALAGRGASPAGLPGPRDGQDRRIAFFERVRDLLCATARVRAPVFLLHDVDRAGGATRALAAYLLRTLAPPPGLATGDEFAGLFVVSARESDPAWLEETNAEQLPLGGLDRDGVRAFLASPHVIDRLLLASGGSPQVLEALLEPPAPPSPERAGARLAERVEALDPIARRLLRALALYGQPCGAAFVQRLGLALSGASAHAHVARATQDLAGSPLIARTVVGGELRLGLARAAERDALARALDPGEAVLLHRALGEALASQGDSADPAACAEHLLCGQAGETAVDAALAAGDVLERSFAYERAAALYAQALPVTSRASVAERLEQRLADLYELSGDYACALDAAKRLAARHPGSASAHGRLGHLHLVRGDFPAARAALARALELAAAAREDDVQILADAAEAHFQEGDHDTAVARATLALTRATGPEHLRSRIAARNAAGKVHLERGDYAQAGVCFAENLAEARRGSLLHEATRAHINLGIAALRRGEHAAAETHYREGLYAARDSGDLRHRAFCLQNLGVLAQWRRDYQAALSSYQGAVQAFKRLGHRPYLAWVALDLGDLYLGLGAPHRAEAMVELAARLCGDEPPATAAAILDNLAGRIALARGELERARQSLESALARATRSGNRDEACLARLHLARVSLDEHDPRAALARLDELCAPGALPARPAKIEAQAMLLRAEAHLALGDAGPAKKELVLAERAFLALEDDEGRLAALLGGVACAERLGDARAARHARDAARSLDAALRARVPEEFQGCYGVDPRRAALAEPDPGAPSLPAPADPLHASLLEAVTTPPAPGGRARPRELAKPRELARIVGESPALREVLAMIERVAPHESLVLIRGESGTGKELVAEAIHELSSRRGRPFVKVNCGALVESLLLSELFGHERGAFTGALARRKGRFEVADGGTIFLDEIGDISPQTQVALLRVLQAREFERVGGTQPIRVDVRILCATNRDLEAMVAAGRFREDLYYRLKGIEIDLPPLRQRPGDIPALAAHFLGQISREQGQAPRRMTPRAVDALARHGWPGNVRELENVLRSVALLADGPEIDASDVIEYLAPSTSALRALPAAATAGAPGALGDFTDLYGRAIAGGLSLRELKRRIEHECITRALAEAGGNITRAAEKLGMKRPRLSQLLKEHGIAPAAVRAGAAGEAAEEQS